MRGRSNKRNLITQTKPLNRLTAFSYNSLILFVIIFFAIADKTVMRKFCDLHVNLRRFKVIQGQQSWWKSISRGWIPIRLLWTPLSYVSPFSKKMTCNYSILELLAHKVIQGQRSWCPLVVSCLTFIASNIVSLTVDLFEIYNTEVLLTRCRTVQGHLTQRSCCQSIAYGWFPIQILSTQLLYASQLLKYLTCNFDKLQSRQFTVSQSQRSWCQSIARGLLNSRPLLTPNNVGPICHRF